MVEKHKDHEKGVEIITPFFTHLDKNEKACGILVNRGWVPWDLKDIRLDR
jgi:cytochrome oxidase assembly protein ShyY1